MLRRNFHLPEAQVRYLESLSKDTGVPIAELVRRIIEKHMLDYAPQATTSPSRKGVIYER